MASPSRPTVAAGLAKLLTAKLPLAAASDDAARRVRSCHTCDAHCCTAAFNSMRVTRIEAEALARRLAEPDLAGRRAEILARAKAEIEKRGLSPDRDATYDCPLLENQRCLVHGPAQPAGCLTFRPVDDGGCDHDRAAWDRAYPGLTAADRTAFGRPTAAVPIPIALVRLLGRPGDAATPRRRGRARR